MECLVKRDDNTVAYIHKIHNYNPKKGTPRPKKKDKDKKDKKNELSENELINILKLFL